MTPSTPTSAIDRLRQTGTFGSWISRYEELAASEIAAYVRRVQETTGGDPRDRHDPDTPSKAVKDALWGMIDLSSAELVVLDSPPLQRLRRIKQLGFSYLTYPTAGYSRFEHTLGAMFQSERLLRSIHRRSSTDVQPFVEAAIPIARLAALLHDVGHLPASHLGERFFGEAECRDLDLLETIEDARTDIADTLAVPKPALGEVLSLVVVLAPSMWSVLTEEAGFKPDQVAAAAMAIVGAPPSLQQAFLPNIITNAIDADKLDYLFRDALVTQIPLAVDLDRLLYKLKVVKVPASEMKEALQRMASVGDTCNVLGTDLTGYDLLYDLLSSRSMLFDRIYLHHKTRAAERMALDVLDELAMNPVDLLCHDDYLYTSPSTDGISDRMFDRRRRLRERDLPRRAFAMSYGFLVAAAQSPFAQSVAVTDEEQLALENLRDDVLGDREYRDELLDMITERRDELAGLLDMPQPFPDLWLDTQPASHDLGDPDLFVELPDGTVQNRASYAQKASTFTRSPLHSAFLYSAGSNQAVQVANIAAEIVIFERYELALGRPATDYAKVDFEAVSALKRRLETAKPDIFAAHGKLRPTSEEAASQWGKTKITGLANRFHAYNVGDSQDNLSMSDEKVQRFVDQFPEKLVKPMLNVLDSMKFLTRDDLGTKMVRSLDVDGAVTSAAAFPLTSDPEKSASTMGPYFADTSTRPKFFSEVARAAESFEEGAELKLVAIDDFCLSGRQAGTVVQRWMGLQGSDLLLPEEADIANELADDLKGKLRGAQIDFRFVFATERGKELLSRTCQDLGLGAVTVGSLVSEQDKATLAQTGEPDLEALTEFLHSVGTQLLASTKQQDNPEKWTDERIEDCALGYGNGGLLVAHQNNCPTGTVTALWSGGTFRGVPWHPLFQRRSSDH